MGAKTASSAVVARLKEGTPIAEGRVYPQTNTPEGALPFVTVEQTANGNSAKLSGKRSALTSATLEVVCYADTQSQADAISKEVRDRLAPSGAPWIDAALGVQGCFYQDGSDDRVNAETTQDTARIARETYLVWHSPT